MATPSTSTPSARSAASTAPPVWQRPWARWAGVLLLVVVLAVMPLALSEFANQTIARIGVYAVAVPFILIFVVLIVRPQGLFGRKVVVRV